MGLRAEDAMQAAFEVGLQELEGIVAAVIDEIAEGQRCLPLIAVSEEVEVDGPAGPQLREAAEQGLRVVGLP